MLMLHVLKYFSVTTYLFVFFHLTCLLSKHKVCPLTLCLSLYLPYTKLSLRGMNSLIFLKFTVKASHQN